MTLSDVSIKRPVFAWMLMLGLIVFGAIGFGRMGISQLPDVDYPVVNVSVTLEGAAPEVMETQVTDVLESAVMTIAGIRDISSTSRRGSARLPRLALQWRQAGTMLRRSFASPPFDTGTR